ncbi:type II secretion system F family protein [Candidatus Uhrbacteria bacterium]|nr:type II secretion system F family protein [Candidatus Uhrbacteria bacterium]
MPQYKYKARNQSDAVVEGAIDADSKDKAASLLMDRELVVTSLEEVGKQSDFVEAINKFFNKVSKKDLAIFLRQLSILIAAAIPLVQALRMLSNQVENKVLQVALREIVDEVEGGTKLSLALERYPKVFGTFFINMIKSGETSGKLDDTLNYLADQQEKDYELQSKIIGAMTYPIFIVSLLIIAAFVMMTFVLPKMLTMFSELGPDVVLPLTTRILISTTGFFQAFWWLILAGAIGLGVGASYYGRTPEGKRMFDTVKLKIPIFGALFKYVYLVRFTRSFSTILVGGITVPQGLRVVRDVIGNAVYEDLIDQTVKAVEDGNPVSSVFSKSKYVPSLVSQMLSVGEQTGRLDDVLNKVTSFYVREINAMIENVISLIEPAIMVLLGLGVGVMVAGILLPMYTLTSQF